MKVLTLYLPRAENRAIWLLMMWTAVAIMTVPMAQADIYSWQDEEGVTHFSNQDVPPAATIYMKAPPPPPHIDEEQEPPAYSDELDRAAIRQRAETEAALEQANQKLSEALEKVEDLTGRVSQAQEEAEEASEAARQAAQATLVAENEAAAAKEDNRRSARKRVIVYTTPYSYPYKYGKHSGTKYRKPYYHRKYKRNHPYRNHKYGQSKMYRHQNHHYKVKPRRAIPVLTDRW